MKNSFDEVNLWDEFRRGNHDAFSKLYQQFNTTLFAYSLSITNDKDLIKD